MQQLIKKQIDTLNSTNENYVKILQHNRLDANSFYQ